MKGACLPVPWAFRARRPYGHPLSAEKKFLLLLECKSKWRNKKPQIVLQSPNRGDISFTNGLCCTLPARVVKLNMQFSTKFQNPDFKCSCQISISTLKFFGNWRPKKPFWRTGWKSMGNRVLTPYNFEKNVNTSCAKHNIVTKNLQTTLCHASKILVMASVHQNVGRFQNQLFFQYCNSISSKALRSIDHNNFTCSYFWPLFDIIPFF